MTRYLVVATNREGRTDHVGCSDDKKKAEILRAAEEVARSSRGWSVAIKTVKTESLEEVVQRWEAAA